MTRSNYRLENNHELSFGARADIRRFLSESALDFNDDTFNTTGRVDVRRDTNVTGAASFSQLHEDPGSPDFPENAAEVTLYQLTRAGAGAFHRLNRVSFSADRHFHYYDYDDSDSIAGGSIDNDDRDRNEYDVVGKVG